MVVPAVDGHGKSMAIWIPLKQSTKTPDTNDRPQGPTANLHFNVWRLGHRGQKTKNSTQSDLLDIGVMVTSPSQISEILIYVPLKIYEKDITDLGPLFSDGALATGIFNESLTSTNGPLKSVNVLTNASGSTFCGVVKFPCSNGCIASSHLSLEQQFDGTVLTITDEAMGMGISGTPAGENLYFRLRLTIPKDGANTFINVAVPDDKLFTSGVDVTEYLDFRLNQVRDLNPGIAQQMTKVGLPIITRLDFLLAVGVAVDVVVGHPDFHKCRLLEIGLWKAYVNESHLKKGMVIYHWKQECKPGQQYVGDFNAFVKLRLRLSGKCIILRYLLIALVFGAIAGVFGDLLSDWLKMGYDEFTSLMFSTSAAAPVPQSDARLAVGVDAPTASSCKTGEQWVNGLPPQAGEIGKANYLGKKGIQ